MVKQAPYDYVTELPTEVEKSISEEDVEGFLNGWNKISYYNYITFLVIHAFGG